jgi:hypothetical protein
MMLTQAGTQLGFTRAHCEATLWSIRAQRDEVNRLKICGNGDRPDYGLSLFHLGAH